MTSSSQLPTSERIADIGIQRECIPPYPCGRGAGANGSDLPCDCEAMAEAGECGCNDDDRSSVLRCPIHSPLTDAFSTTRVVDELMPEGACPDCDGMVEHTGACGERRRAASTQEVRGDA